MKQFEKLSEEQQEEIINQIKKQREEKEVEELMGEK